MPRFMNVEPLDIFSYNLLKLKEEYLVDHVDPFMAGLDAGLDMVYTKMDSLPIVYETDDEDVELQPVIHMHWTIDRRFDDGTMLYICSNCGETISLSGDISKHRMNYCWACGAIADEKSLFLDDFYWDDVY